jgi:HK97 gp10 family phage protein
LADFQNISIQGFEDFKRQLALLPGRVGRNVLRGAVNAGATVIRKEVALRAPEYTGPVAEGHPPPGTLKRAVYQKQIAELSSAVQQTFFVGVRAGKRQQTLKRGGKTVNLDAYYGRFVEFGTSKMSARPFLRPAFEAKKEAAIEAMRAYMAERIPKELDKGSA